MQRKKGISFYLLLLGIPSGMIMSMKKNRLVYVEIAGDR